MAKTWSQIKEEENTKLLTATIVERKVMGTPPAEETDDFIGKLILDACEADALREKVRELEARIVKLEDICARQKEHIFHITYFIPASINPSGEEAFPMSAKYGIMVVGKHTLDYKNLPEQKPLHLIQTKEHLEKQYAAAEKLDALERRYAFLSVYPYNYAFQNIK